MKRCEGKVALVTGSAQGMGRGIALSLAAEGAHVCLNDLCPPGCVDEILDEIRAMGCQAAYCQADVADREQVARMFSQVVEQFGRLDICVANAAISIRANVIDADWEQVLHTLSVSQFGNYHTCQMAAQQMVKQVRAGQAAGGKIVIISSVHEELAIRGSGAYNMAKAAATQLGKTMAMELAPFHINVNVVHPGLTDTPNTWKMAAPGAKEKAAGRIPWGRVGQPEDIGKAVAFLCSDDADYITGVVLRVDGGYVLGPRFPLDD